MFTAMYDFKDSYGRLYRRSCRIGGFKTINNAVKAIIRKSPFQTGIIQIGQQVEAIVVKGRMISRP